MTQEKVKSESHASNASNSEIEWNAEAEVQLFYAMRGHKPVGISRNFQMICILESFMNSTSKDVSSKTIWSHLETMYDMDALHENEDPPFPNVETDFTIEGNPDFEELITQKMNTSNVNNKSEKSNESHEQTQTLSNIKMSLKSSNAGNIKSNDSGKNTKKLPIDGDKNQSAKNESRDETVNVKTEKDRDDGERSNKSYAKKNYGKAETPSTKSSSMSSNVAKKRRLNMTS